MPVGSLDDPQTKPHYGKFLDDVVDLGATDLELVVRWYQVDTKAIEIAPSVADTVDDDLLIWLMDEANTRGLRVCLTPLLEIESHAENQWRGAIAPETWDRWWWSYQRFVTHYARLAGSRKAALLSVGSELVTTEDQPDRWRALVRAVRKIYRGKLSYGAHIDHVADVQFWDALDLVSVTGIRKYLDSTAGTDEQLRQQLLPWARKLRNWALAEGKHYVFSDLGYVAARETPTPADDGALLMQELRRQRALYEVWQDDPRLDGVLFGAWLSHAPRQAPPGFRARPAGEVLRHWYRASQVSAQGSVLN